LAGKPLFLAALKLLIPLVRLPFLWGFRVSALPGRLVPVMQATPVMQVAQGMVVPVVAAALL
jgi:hypothetical protein